MTVLIIIALWLIAPFAELAVIVWLADVNRHYKRQIAKLTGGCQEAGRKEEPVKCEGYDLQSASTYYYNDRRDEGRLQRPAAALSAYVQNNLANIALVIGVIFVALSGLIFATTRWQVLSDSSKTLMVLAASGLFFGASKMTERMFGIRKTGNAFYILGSVFLFLTITAAAYFQLFGSAFTLEGESRWMVLWTGTLVLEAALLIGAKRFQDQLYTQAALWTMTFSLCFLAKVFGAERNELMGVMAWLGAGLCIWQRKRHSEGLSAFLMIHFILFAGVNLLAVLEVTGLSSIFWLLCLLFSWDTLGSCVAGFGTLTVLALISSVISGMSIQQNKWKLTP